MRIELLDSAEKDLLDGFKFYELNRKDSVITFSTRFFQI